MPFRSKAQRAYMHIHHPGIAGRWERDTPTGKRLPDRVDDDLIPGGKGDGHSPDEFDPMEVAMGIRHEMEHTDDPGRAQEIAIDHLIEDPRYYSDLRAAGRLLGAENESLGDYFP